MTLLKKQKINLLFWLLKLKVNWSINIMLTTCFDLKIIVRYDFLEIVSNINLIYYITCYII